MTAGRLYCIQSWNNASAYSGEQIGSRLAQSRALHFTRDGKANTALYSEEETVKAKPKRSVRNKIVPQQTRLDNLEKLMLELEEEHESGEISTREYLELSAVLEKKRTRAYQLLCKAMNWDDSESLAQHEQPIEFSHYTQHNESSNLYSTEEKTSVFLTLRDDNVFKVVYMKIKRIAEVLK